MFTVLVSLPSVSRMREHVVWVASMRPASDVIPPPSSTTDFPLNRDTSLRRMYASTSSLGQTHTLPDERLHVLFDYVLRRVPVLLKPMSWPGVGVAVMIRVKVGIGAGV